MFSFCYFLSFCSSFVFVLFVCSCCWIYFYSCIPVFIYCYFLLYNKNRITLATTTNLSVLGEQQAAIHCLGHEKWQEKQHPGHQHHGQAACHTRPQRVLTCRRFLGNTQTAERTQKQTLQQTIGIHFINTSCNLLSKLWTLYSWTICTKVDNTVQ